MSQTRSTLHPGPDGWLLDASGAALHPGERVAVIADVHLGYEWARAAAGDCIPPHGLRETLERLSSMIERAPFAVGLVIVAGDLVETPRPCLRTERDVSTLRAWLDERGIALLALPGNHDPVSDSLAPRTYEVGRWTVAHGHEPVNAGRRIIGHFHPVLKLGGLTAPCFLVGRSTIVLPAFSPNAAGVGLATMGLTHEPDGSPLQCIAAAGATLLDFGPASRWCPRSRSRHARARR